MTANILITGAARRIGAAIARALHGQGCNVVIHFRESVQAAEALRDELNAQRSATAEILQADLLDTNSLPQVAEQAVSVWGRIDALINNASVFYSTPLDIVTEEQWDELVGCNLKAPFFLSRVLAPELAKNNGSIINLLDIHASRPLQGFSAYSISKSGMVSMTRSLARELAPDVRVNGIAPGAILWPENETDDEQREKIIAKIALRKTGVPQDIARAVSFLLDSDYITGQVIVVDGGRTLYS